MPTSDAVLAVLSTGPRHGYDLKRSYDEWFAGMRPLAYGQVYSTLSRLQRDGLVAVAHTESGDGPDRVVYELTPAGAEQVRTWVDDPVDPQAGNAEELVRKAIAAHRTGADVGRMVARQREVHLRRMRQLGPGDPASPAALLDEQTRLHLDADLRWLDFAEAGLRRTRTEAPHVNEGTRS
jgi:DNA-binding PadR family transcriptional regulator